MSKDLLLSNYSYNLPPELIAQTPVSPRDSSRLLVVNSPSTHHHSIFSTLPDWLLPGDLLVLNNTRVIPARLFGAKSTGAAVEVLLLEETETNCWLALVKPGKRFKLGTKILFTPQHNQTNGNINTQTLKGNPRDLTLHQKGARLSATVVAKDEVTGGRILRFDCDSPESFWQLLSEFGEVPLPPYITSRESQPLQYQTVFAQKDGAVAAPTAGLHFTHELLDKLQSKGIDQTYITLHVGVGTFRPVEVEKITEHQMHQEWIEVSEETTRKIKETKARGGRIIAVGTTAVRALEGAAQSSLVDEGNELQAFRGKTNLFIYPGYDWQIVDGLITNFHLPGSSLLMLVSALTGRERLFSLYQDAIANRYRFYSFGDAMLILS
ncbi:S-adenosylmethionine:tRNA ribosyltransferase-isomerase [Xenococcus sp. PCC 7305]|uniref:tRNA preQ1(34) S-adenosylmethionine ribosyltransferase-isomerase QueA n=1 Tax=Xenococcus sp. PCC 7305 TaxID=102125 RepID=UPI0002AC7EFB|nr:tRNA preQ1(34) S-adenosylmethionine ribosyltransferase-isomerase QueA [Xenococcus sp. PCC 7305]ELS03327.1 S-adenosylmethionine:tRNA ribosyltransferase-isomerase [Xenococcus sp. PCC 7305]